MKLRKIISLTILLLLLPICTACSSKLDGKWYVTSLYNAESTEQEIIDSQDTYKLLKELGVDLLINFENGKGLLKFEPEDYAEDVALVEISSTSNQVIFKQEVDGEARMSKGTYEIKDGLMVINLEDTIINLSREPVNPKE